MSKPLHILMHPADIGPGGYKEVAYLRILSLGKFIRVFFLDPFHGHDLVGLPGTNPYIAY